MRRSITAPIRTMLENEFRSLAHVRSKTPPYHFIGPHLQDAATKKMRFEIGLLLQQLDRPSPTLADGSPNHYLVRLTRISAGQADGHDGLRGGTMKAVVDAVASWIGIDDGHVRIQWEYDQNGCPLKMFALRIEIEDLAPGVDVVIERGRLPERMLQSRPRGIEKPKTGPRAPDAQTEIVFRESWALCPWDQDGSGDPILTPLAVKGDPPAKIQLRVPAAIFASSACVRLAPGTMATFERSLGRVDGREAWIFSLPEGAADTRGAATSRRTR